jgi:hypothetical protein
MNKSYRFSQNFGPITNTLSPSSIKVPGNTTGCRACKEAMEYIKAKTQAKESFVIVVSFESGVTHYNTPISKVQFDKLNNQFQILK